MTTRPPLGTVGWIDLTVDKATDLLAFYKDVIGWSSSAFDMGAYEDYCVQPDGAEPVAGICHNTGDNAGTPAVWMIYVVVADAAEAAERAKLRGGEVVMGPKPVMDGHMAIIKDPAGAHIGVMSWPDHA